MRAPLAIGARLGKLVLIEHVEPPKFGKPEPWSIWRCDCGREKKIRTRAVLSGGTRSCGCAAQTAMRGLMSAHRAEWDAQQKALGRR